MYNKCKSPTIISITYQVQASFLMPGVNVVGETGSEDEKEREMRCEKKREEVPTLAVSLSLSPALSLSWNNDRGGLLPGCNYY